MIPQPLETLLMVMMIAISLTLASLCYIGWKNISTATTKLYPKLQLSVYLNKLLIDDEAVKVLEGSKMEAGIKKVNYLSREEVRSEFTQLVRF